MATGTVDVIAPRALIIPETKNSDQEVSGAIFISGQELYFFPYGESAALRKVTSTD